MMVDKEAAYLQAWVYILELRASQDLAKLGAEYTANI